MFATTEKNINKFRKKGDCVENELGRDRKGYKTCGKGNRKA